jgi:(p)ppGpp synthase/HD superfamily hydrolase
MQLTPRLQKAINLATTAHRHQLRKDKQTPYIAHPFSVSVLLSEYTDDEDIIIAALLHDIIEDVPEMYSEQQMRVDFGDRVVGIVLEVTEDKSVTDWQERKRQYCKGLESDSQEALLLSTADMLQNLTSMLETYDEVGSKFFENFTTDQATRVKAYAKRIAILKRRLHSPLVARLEEVFEKFKKIQD